MFSKNIYNVTLIKTCETLFKPSEVSSTQFFMFVYVMNGWERVANNRITIFNKVWLCCFSQIKISEFYDPEVFSLFKELFHFQEDNKGIINESFTPKY